MNGKVLNRDVLKYIAIFTMTLDHIGWYFLSFFTPTAQIFHILGRTTAPVMCFFMAEGYTYTKSKKKYALRLFVFALLSQFPWWYLHDNYFTLSFNMMFTLFLCLCAIFVFDTVENTVMKTALIILICYLTTFCDWHIYAVLWCLVFYKYKDNEYKKFTAFSVVSLFYVFETFIKRLTDYEAGLDFAVTSSLFTLGVFLSIPLLMMYNGKKGNFRMNKWVFYWYYPVHLFIICVIKMYM